MIAARLAKAFATTHYRIRSPAGGFVLKVGRRSPFLALNGQALLGKGAVVVTAWNPLARRRDRAANEAAARRLRGRILAQGLQAWPSVAHDLKRAWPDETGWLVFGIGEGEAVALGREFAQLAVLIVGADAVPRLRWL